jgi:hypothetical protein
VAASGAVTWFNFRWDVFVTDDVLARLGAGVDPALPANDLRPRLAPLVARLLNTTARCDIAPREYSPGERSLIALDLIRGPLDHALARSRRRTVPGYVTDAAGEVRRVTPVDRIAVNIASAAELDVLPGVSAATADRIVDQRAARPFWSLRDLEDRVDGIGPASAARIGEAVSFSLPVPERTTSLTDGLDADWRALVATRPALDPIDRLAQALQLLILQVQVDPDPVALDLPAGPIAAPEAPTHTVDGVEVLLGSRYRSAISALLNAAAARIDVCMFHIALTSPNHPTATLLDAVAAAQARGVAVRVLVDSDRKEDPYRSSVINAPAVRRLRTAGVPVRTDASDHLLHSKFLVVDEDTALVGSHNWSAGSYYQFDDLTLLLRGATLNAELRERFDQLWSGGTDV